ARILDEDVARARNTVGALVTYQSLTSFTGPRYLTDVKDLTHQSHQAANATNVDDVLIAQGGGQPGLALRLVPDVGHLILDRQRFEDAVGTDPDTYNRAVDTLNNAQQRVGYQVTNALREPGPLEHIALPSTGSAAAARALHSAAEQRALRDYTGPMAAELREYGHHNPDGLASLLS